MDTSTYTHLCRSGHADIIEKLAPNGVVIVPTDVNTEIEQGRERYEGIPAVSSVSWAEIAVLSEDEVWTQLGVKAQMGGQPDEHLGECAVIACALHRNMIAILDERAAVAQANRLHVPTHDTLWIVIEAYKQLYLLRVGELSLVAPLFVQPGPAVIASDDRASNLTVQYCVVV